MAEFSKSEEAFIDQMTRKVLVEWADYCIRTGEGLPDPHLDPETQVYFDHAIERGWIGKTVKNGCRSLTATGWNTAAAFLRR